MADDKIYLRPFTDEDGNICIVDQDGRKVEGMKSVRVFAEFEDVVNFEMECLATRPHNGAISRCWTNGKAKP